MSLSLSDIVSQPHITRTSSIIVTPGSASAQSEPPQGTFYRSAGSSQFSPAVAPPSRIHLDVGQPSSFRPTTQAVSMTSSHGRGPQTSSVSRSVSLGTKQRTALDFRSMNNRPSARVAKQSRDRFIPLRRSPTASTKNFHVSKPFYKLSGSERILRQRSVSSDPFGPLSQSRTALVERASPARVTSRRIYGFRSLANGNMAVIEPSDTLLLHPSDGTVWHIGGSAAAIEGPLAGISNGRGGLLSSGSNARMYVSRFLEEISPDQELEKHEGRLALALDVDMAGRILDFGSPMDTDGDSSPNSLRDWSSGSVIGRYRNVENSRTIWQDNRWVTSGRFTGTKQHWLS